jgi:RNA polymerase sigma factor (sigma-70 family)
MVARGYVSDAGLARRVHRERDDAAFAMLADRHRRLLANMTRGYHLPPGLAPEDMHQAALLGLWDACCFFLPEGSGSFAAFARPCIRHRIYYLLRGARTKKNVQLNTSDSFDAPLGIRPRRAGRDRMLEELLPAATTTAQIAEAREELHLLAEALPPALTPGQRDALARKLNGELADTPRRRMVDRSQMLRVRRKALALLGRAA